MRDKILSFLNTLDFEMNDEHVEPFIMFINKRVKKTHKEGGSEPLGSEYLEEEKPPKYFRTLLFLFNKEKI